MSGVTDRYDEVMYTPQYRAFFEDSDFANFGYWEPGKAKTSIDSWPAPSTQPDLARAAVPIVQLLAKQHGVEVDVPPLGGSGSHRSPFLIPAAAVVLAVLVAGALLLRRRAGSHET